VTVFHLIRKQERKRRGGGEGRGGRGGRKEGKKGESEEKWLTVVSILGQQKQEWKCGSPFDGTPAPPSTPLAIHRSHLSPHFHHLLSRSKSHSASGPSTGQNMSPVATTHVCLAHNYLSGAGRILLPSNFIREGLPSI
jgi:hypothetical protein